MEKENNKKAEDTGDPLPTVKFETFTSQKRRCTDSFCYLILIACWAALTIIGLVAVGVIDSDVIPQGNPERLIHPYDYKGRLCGNHDEVKDREFGYYMPDGSTVCVKTCPSENDFTSFICQDDIQDRVDTSNIAVAYEYVATGRCFYKIKSKALINRCIPGEDLVKMAAEAAMVASDNGSSAQGISSLMTSYSSDISDWFQQFTSDISELYPYVLSLGIGLTIILCMLYMLFLRIPGLLRILIWTTLIGIQLIFILWSYFLFSLAEKWDNDENTTKSSQDIQSTYVVSYICMAFTFLYFCAMIVLLKKINLAIGIIKVSARAMFSMVSVLLLPFIQIIGFLIFLVPFGFFLFYLASSGEVKTITISSPYSVSGLDTSYQYQQFTYTMNTQYVFLYYLFMFFWTSEFILAVGQLTFSLSFTSWFFTRDKSKVKSSTFFWSLYHAFISHGGTAAVGSFLVAVVKFIRYLVNRFLKNTKYIPSKTIKAYITAMVNCCFTCLEKFLKFINKNAYIGTAIYNWSFFFSAKQSFFLFLRNISQIATISMFSYFIILLGKILIPLITTFILYWTLLNYESEDDQVTNSIIGILILNFIISYIFANLFLEILGMAINCITYCYLADLEMHKLEDRFAPPELLTMMEKYAKSYTLRNNRVIPITSNEENLNQTNTNQGNPNSSTEKDDVVF